MGWGRLGLLRGATVLVALTSFAPAFAADLPVKAPAPVPAPVDWSGAYVGVHAGYSGGMSDWSGGLGDMALVDPFDFPVRGFLGGGQIGINKQIASFVFGLELDGSWADMRGSQTTSTGGPLFGTQTTTSVSSRIDRMVTFAGRAGLAADRWFVFAKGGLAGVWERHTYNQTNLIFGFGPDFTENVAANEFRLSPMLGLGAEYALAGNWSVKAEYDYVHLGSRMLSMKGTDTTFGVTTPASHNFLITQDAVHAIKLGANYRFGGVAVDQLYRPVMAAAGTNWTGAFAGVEGGYGFGHKRWSSLVDPTIPASGNYDVKGWLGGVDGGINAQAGSFVFGVEGEWMWTGLTGGQSFTATDLFETDVTTLHTAIDWLAIASARAGFVVGDKLLLYGKAGIAIASERHAYGMARLFPFGSDITSLDAKAVHSGVVIGAGAEYAIGGNWSIKGEYDYIRMAGQSLTGTGVENFATPGFTGQVAATGSFNGVEQSLQLFKIGANYHFSPAMIAAR